MTFEEVLLDVRELALKTNCLCGDARWYLFGSVKNGLTNATDIDLLVVCATHEMSDIVRRNIDLDQMTRPIHLSILTDAEEAEVRFVECQKATRVA